MALATALLAGRRAGWASAMRAEYRIASADGDAFGFAFGCLAAAWRDTLSSTEGRYALTNYAMAIAIMVPMAGVQIGCAAFGFPYLYPNEQGLPGALLEGGAHEGLLRSIYLAAIPALALIQVLTGIGHLRLAWLLVERDWPGVVRWGAWTIAAAIALILFMGVLFLDSRQALMQGGILAVEILILVLAARRHAELNAAKGTPRPD